MSQPSHAALLLSWNSRVRWKIRAMLGAKLRSAPCFRGFSLGAEAHREDAHEEEAEVLGPSFPLRYRFSFRDVV